MNVINRGTTQNGVNETNRLLSIERFHLRDQHTCKFIEIKGSVYIIEERVQLSQAYWFGTSTWSPFHCFVTPIWLP